MLYLKACPRCRGDIHYATDIDGPYLQCLQCGFNVASGRFEAVAAGSNGGPVETRTSPTLRLWEEVVAASAQGKPPRRAGDGNRAPLRFWEVVFLRDALRDILDRTADTTATR